MLKFELTEIGASHVDRYGDCIGYIRFLGDENDQTPLKDQFDKMYSYGGGWNPIKRFKMLEGAVLEYPGDPVLHPLATAKFRNQYVHIYKHAFVSIVEEDGSFEVARMD
jgi:hypothetical protein